MTQHEIEQLKKKYSSERELDKAIQVLADLLIKRMDKRRVKS